MELNEGNLIYNTAKDKPEPLPVCLSMEEVKSYTFNGHIEEGIYEEAIPKNTINLIINKKGSEYITLKNIPPFVSSAIFTGKNLYIESLPNSVTKLSLGKKCYLCSTFPKKIYSLTLYNIQNNNLIEFLKSDMTNLRSFTLHDSIVDDRIIRKIIKSAENPHLINVKFVNCELKYKTNDKILKNIEIENTVKKKSNNEVFKDMIDEENVIINIPLNPQ